MDSFKHSRKIIPMIFKMFLERRKKKEIPQVIFVKSHKSHAKNWHGREQWASSPLQQWEMLNQRRA